MPPLRLSGTAPLACLILVAVTLLGTVLPGAEARGEFSPSVVLTSMEEMQNHCSSMVDNALKLNARSIKVHVRMHLGLHTHTHFPFLYCPSPACCECCARPYRTHVPNA